MPDSSTFLIVGASLTGATAAATLRAEGFDGRILLVGEEDGLPYERPPLSKDYLRGQAEADAAFVHPAVYYDEQRIELISSEQVNAIDPTAHTATLAAGETLTFDKLLLATGGSPRRSTLPGADLAGVHYLRTMADSDALRERLLESPRVVVIGGGWIGCEVAASARELGAEVTIVEQAPTLLNAVLGDELGGVISAAHAGHGVRVLTGIGVHRLGGAGRVELVELSDGREIAADLVVVGIGAVPRTELAEAAGLAVENGIVVNERLQSSAPDIFAAGDVAAAFNQRYGGRIRSEHWQNARVQGALAARSMLGGADVNDAVPFFFSDQYDIGMEYRGHHQSGDELVVRGELESREFVAFWLRGDRLTAALNMNVWDMGDAIDGWLVDGQVSRSVLAS